MKGTFIIIKICMNNYVQCIINFYANLLKLSSKSNSASWVWTLTSLIMSCCIADIAILVAFVILSD